MPKPSLAAMRAEIARAERASRKTGDTSSTDEVRRDYTAAKLADYIQRVVAAAPALTAEQRERLADQLRGGGQRAS